ncbi:hypothetical protein H7J07_16670 [Mycobacterium koreense]|uniref:Uncharacterized protein n=1 Tax=Mycolicibacillus koreensis TaxID=1069220 RepID=A0A7I7S7J8_9MYCO|nr:hypothetical protein [Mycolicibacillus koreensis]MCV7249838.1 hypothetical protein [Mycolicibacillus koreensis]OSC32865.1 hypothetical protein B8W67_13455 [Mycolicibacillus koreensis]BBY52798.1 hypothetical protein MKOR_00490 [Mycolicibacillus koreensis]
MTATTRRTAPAGIALLGATVVALPVAAAPATPAPAWSVPSIELTASAALDLVDSVADWLQPSLTTALVETLVTAPDATGPIGGAIESLYSALEYWVNYGVTLVEWAAEWVPFVGLLAPQIGFIYDFGESLVQSALWSSIAVLDGSISFGAGLSDFGTDFAAAVGAFITDQIRWIKDLLPPLPFPIGLSTTMLPDLASALAPDLTTMLQPGADLGAGALSGVAGDLAANLSQLLLGLFA